MPTNCWNTDRMMPIQTIGCSPRALPRIDTPAFFLSVSMARVSSFIVLSRSTAGTRRAKTARASSLRPWLIRKRGDSGTVNDRMP